jgi:hypothetical protein
VITNGGESTITLPKRRPPPAGGDLRGLFNAKFAKNAKHAKQGIKFP